MRWDEMKWNEKRWKKGRMKKRWHYVRRNDEISSSNQKEEKRIRQEEGRKEDIWNEIIREDGKKRE